MHLRQCLGTKAGQNTSECQRRITAAYPAAVLGHEPRIPPCGEYGAFLSKIPLNALDNTITQRAQANGATNTNAIGGVATERS